MSDTMAIITRENHVAKHDLPIYRSEHRTLVDSLEKIVATAQPRLAQLARMQGVAPDGIDDVVQETFVEACSTASVVMSACGGRVRRLLPHAAR